MFDPTIDSPSLLTGAVQVILGCLFFPAIFYIVQGFLRFSSLGRLVCSKYGIKNHGVFDISNKVTSSTFAFLACSTGIFVARRCTEDVLTERFYILDNYLIFGVSYFFYDLASMYCVHSTQKKEEVTVSFGEVVKFCQSRPMIIFHHVFVPLVGFPALMYFRGGTGDCLLGTSFLIEASTPFVSLRVILVHLQMKDTRIYLINGLLMLFSFLLCRVLLFPYLYCWYSSVLGLSVLSMLVSVSPWVHLAVLALWTPQLFWFHRMLKGSMKIIRETRTKKDKNKEDPIEDNNEQEGEVIISESPVLDSELSNCESEKKQN